MWTAENCEKLCLENCSIFMPPLALSVSRPRLAVAARLLWQRLLYDLYVPTCLHPAKLSRFQDVSSIFLYLLASSSPAKHRTAFDFCSAWQQSSLDLLVKDGKRLKRIWGNDVGHKFHHSLRCREPALVPMVAFTRQNIQKHPKAKTLKCHTRCEQRWMMWSHTDPYTDPCAMSSHVKSCQVTSHKSCRSLPDAGGITFSFWLQFGNVWKFHEVSCIVLLLSECWCKEHKVESVFRPFCSGGFCWIWIPLTCVSCQGLSLPPFHIQSMSSYCLRLAELLFCFR